jgi:putative MATE family efflux protein
LKDVIGMSQRAFVSSDLTKGSISDHIKAIAAPAAIGFLFNTLFNVVDSIYAGRVGTDALAGLALSFPIFFLVLSISSGIGNATSALTSIALGKKDKNEFHQLLTHALGMAVLISIFIAFFSRSITGFLFSLTGAEGDSLSIGVNYTSMILNGFIFFMFNFILNGLLYAQGNSKPFRNYLIFGFFANIVLNPLLIFGFWIVPSFGVIGIAIATIMVQAGGVLYLGYYVIRSSEFDFSRLKKVKVKLLTIMDILKQGIPSTMSTATIAIGIFIINYFVLLYGGSETVAAYGVSLRIEQLALIPTIGLNVAALSIVGQNFGANQFDRIDEARKKTTLYGVTIMLIGAVIIFPFAPYLISLFDSNPSVVSAGTTYLRIETLAFTTYVFINISISVLQGIKKPGFAIYLGLYRQIFPIVIFYTLGTLLGWGIYGVWWGIVFINWSAVFIGVFYTSYQLRKIRKEKATQE